MRLTTIAIMLLSSIAISAHADTKFALVDFLETGNPNNVDLISIDTTLGTFGQGTFRQVAGTVQYVISGSPTTQGSLAPLQEYFGKYYDSNNDYFLLIVPVNSLIGYQGSKDATINVCSVFLPCGSDISGFYNNSNGVFTPLVYGTLEPIFIPEPSTLALLGTGVLGMVGSVRRQLRAWSELRTSNHASNDSGSFWGHF